MTVTLLLANAVVQVLLLQNVPDVELVVSVTIVLLATLDEVLSPFRNCIVTVLEQLFASTLNAALENAICRLMYSVDAAEELPTY